MSNKTKRIGVVLSCLVSVCMFSHCLLPVKAAAETRAMCEHRILEYMGEYSTGEYDYDRDSGHYEIMNTVFRCGSCHIEIITNTYEIKIGDHHFKQVIVVTRDGIIVDIHDECIDCGYIPEAKTLGLK